MLHLECQVPKEKCHVQFRVKDQAREVTITTVRQCSHVLAKRNHLQKQTAERRETKMES